MPKINLLLLLIRTRLFDLTQDNLQYNCLRLVQAIRNFYRGNFNPTQTSVSEQTDYLLPTRPFRQSLTFSVVEPVDSQDDLDLVRVLDEHGCVLSQLDEALEGDADGECLDVHGATGKLGQHVVAVHATP